MDRKERYDHHIRPYTKPPLAIEFLSLPAFSLIIFAIGGSLPLAIAAGLTWTICDGLFVSFTGCSLFGIYLRGSPAELSDLSPQMAKGGLLYKSSGFFLLLFIASLFASDFLLVYILPTQTAWQEDLMVVYYYQAIFMLAYLRLNFLGGKPDPWVRYEKHMLVFFGVLIISLAAAFALLVHSANTRTFILIIDLVPAAFVVYFAFKLIMKKPVGSVS